MSTKTKQQAEQRQVAYEILVIFKPILDLDSADAPMKALMQVIEQFGGKIIRVEKMGRKRLAYEINKFKDGFLATLEVELPTNKVADLRRGCQINEDILRVSLLRRENIIGKRPAPPRLGPPVHSAS